MTTRAEGLVRVSYGTHGVARLGDGRQVMCAYRRGVGRPCCGDRVRVSLMEGGSAAVEEIMPRRNQFLRADARQRPVVVAANLDRVLIVIAPRPRPSRELLDRYLVAVHSLGMEPLIVLNKTDLGSADHTPGVPVLQRLPHYERLGYPVIRTSCKAAPGVTALAPELAGRTSILVGQSGVGKSSLVGALLPNQEIQIGALSRATGKGTHTTTTTILYLLPDGGRLIDSPGVWEYGLWRIDESLIAAGFVEFRPLLGQCRFNDCRHRAEPGCAIKRAVGRGDILEWRYQAYLRLLAGN